MSTFSLILKYRLMYALLPSAATQFKDLLKQLKELFLNLIQNVVTWPSHSSLQDVIDNWVEITVNGGEGFFENTATHGAHPRHVDPVMSEGTLLLLTVYPHEILNQTSLFMDHSSSSAIANGLPQKNLSTQLSRSWFQPFSFLTSHLPHFSVVISDLFQCQSSASALILDDELLDQSLNQLKHGSLESLTLPPPQQDLMIFAPLFRAAISCYLALKYQAVCALSPQTQYTCVFSTDPRDLPLRGALVVFYLSAVWESSVQRADNRHSSQLQRFSWSPDSSHEFFSGFTRLVRLLSPELLLVERSLTLTQSSLAHRLVESSSSDKKDDLLDIFRYSITTLYSSTVCPLHQLIVIFHRQQDPSRMTTLMIKILREILVTIPPTIAGPKFSVQTSFIPPPPPHCDRVLDDLWNLWRAVHSMHLFPAQYELETLNTLLDISNTHHPHSISSYTTLVREPLILFRLPLHCYLNFTTASILLYIFRSITVASRAHCHQTYRVNKCLAKQVLSHAILPKTGPSSVAPSHMKSPHTVTPIPVMVRDGSSRIENLDVIEENDFLNLQDLLSVRLFSEIWAQICIVIAPFPDIPLPLLSDFQNWIRLIPERFLHAFRDSVTLLIQENPGIVESLLYYGISSFSCFYLVASSSLHILHAFLEKIQFSISNHTDPHMLLASRNMELILLHFQYLLITISSSPLIHSSSSAPLSFSSPHLDFTLSTHHMVTLFVSFLKKSLKFHCWKQQFTANPTLGRSLMRCLVILSDQFPLQTLKIIENFTSKDLFASPSAASSPALLSLSSVLGEIQDHLLSLQSTILLAMGICGDLAGNGRANEAEVKRGMDFESVNGIKESEHAEKRPRLQ